MGVLACMIIGFGVILFVIAFVEIIKDYLKK